MLPQPAGGTPVRPTPTRKTRSNVTLPALLPIQTTTETPAPPTATPEPSPVSVSAVLKLFPLALGNTWTYTYSQYTQAANDPLKTLQGIYEVTRQVVEVRTVGEVTLVHIRQAVKKVSEDPGFSDSEGAPSIPDSFWYILRDNNVYSSVYLPIDLKDIDTAASQITVQGNRYPEQLEKMTGR